MTSPTLRRIRRLGLVVAMWFAVLGLSSLAAPAAHADHARLVVAIKAVFVAGATPDSVVEVTGTVTNPGTDPAYGVRVTMLRSATPYRSLLAVRNAIAGEHAASSEAVTAPESAVERLTEPDAAIDPGESKSFSVSGTLSELGLAADASYWVGAEATGSPSSNGSSMSDLTGQAETLATVPDATGPTVVTIVQLTTTPRRLEPNLFSDDELAEELAGSGRLGKLLDSVASHKLGYAIDPELLDEVIDMADGYAVIDGEDEADGMGREVAAQWLKKFAALPSNAGIVGLYGTPDLVGAAAAKSSSVLDRSLAASRTANLSLPVVAVQRRMSKASLADLAEAGIPALTPALDADSPWVTLDQAHISGAYWATAAADQPVLGTGPLGRDMAALAIARAVGTQVRLVSTDVDLGAEATLPPWVKRGTWSALTAGALGATSSKLTTPAAKGTLTRGQIKHLDRLALDLDIYAAAATQSGLSGMSNKLTSAAASEAWLDSPSGRRTFTDLLAEETGASELSGGITVSVAQTIVLGGSSNTFPATITNHLPNTITVRVAAISSNSARMSVAPSELVTIAPNDSDTVQLAATASGNGVVTASLHVEAESGQRVSPSVPVTLEATNLGMVGWIIMAVSFVVLAVTTALRIRQVRRRNAK